MTNKEFKNWLMENRLTNVEFAEFSNLSKTFVSYLVNGKRPITDRVKNAMEKFEQRERSRWTS